MGLLSARVFPLRKEENALSGVAASRDGALEDFERLVLLTVVLEQPRELRVDLDEVSRWHVGGTWAPSAS